jgi:methyl-accepting chemotaxis protein
MDINDLKVVHRLGLGFGAVLVLTLAVAASGVIGLNRLNAATDELALDRVPKLITASDWEISVLQGARHMRNVLIVDGQDAVNQELAAIVEQKKQRKVLLATLQQTIITDEGANLLRNIVAARASFVVQEDVFMTLAAAGKLTEAKQVLRDSARSLQLKYLEEIAHFIDFQRGKVASTAERASTAHGEAVILVLGLAGMALALGGMVAYWLGRGLTRQLGGEPGAATAVARAVARGELNTPITVRAGDTTSLMAAIGEMRSNLAQVVADVRGNSESVASASAQIAEGNLDLSRRTETQASALQEAAATMHELGNTVRHNSDNAKQANQLALGASAVAARGGEVVNRVVGTMKGINDSSRRIADIISVIDGIAFQTNILALNAAVEAARAGEQGRGFAVVASEVRSLAQRSAAAAKEIKTLITDSVEQVEQGSTLVSQAGQTMQEIVDAARRVSDIVGEISTASAQQSAGVSQVGDTVMQMDQATQQNAALVEQSAAAAKSLTEQAQHLVQAVAVFRLD